MENGYIKLFRSLKNKKLWTAEKFTKGQAWVDLLMLTNYEPKEITVRGIPVRLKRGECGWSIRSLAQRWGWKRGATERFLNRLQTEQRIVQQKNRVTTVITITNYDQYQANGPQTGPQTVHKTGHKTFTGRKKKEYKKEVAVPKGPYSEPLPAILDTPNFRETLSRWLGYKHERDEGYAPTGFKSFITHTANIAEQEGLDRVIGKMIRAMAQGWKGWDFSDDSKSHQGNGARIEPIKQRMPTAEEDAVYVP